MRKKYPSIRLLTILFLLLSASLLAQMSDQQVMIEIKRYSDSGMSQQQIFQELTKKGATASQLQRIRNQYAGQGKTQANTRLSSNYNSQFGTLRNDTIITRPLSSIPLAIDTIAQEDKVYGHDFFSSDNLTFAPNMNMPTPANYVLGPGDEAIIDVWGNSELNVRYTIAPDGHITVPGLGRIQLSGLSVQQAESRIRNEFSSIYSDLDSENPGTFLAISVGNVRTIRVNVMGEVVTPGTYTLSSFASAFQALYISGGPNKIGSLRNIHVFRNGKIASTVDLYEYLMNGNNMGDITLRDGDIVRVAPYGILSQITGEVKRPMWYEMHQNETLQDLIRFAGGFTGNAFKGNVSLLRKGSAEMQAHTLNNNQYAYFNMQDGDEVFVGDILTRFTNRVEITGAVYRPGQYAIGDQIKTVKGLVAIAQGVTGDAYTQRALLYRENEDKTQTMQSFDLSALLNNQIADITLQRNDRLHIPSVLSLEDSLTVYVGGEVRRPDSYPYATNMRIEDIILQAGGLKESASTARIDVYRRIKNPSSTSRTSASGEAFSFSLRDGEIVSNAPSFVLEPFDQVVVRRSPGYEEQENITVSGEVLFGGQYAKMHKNERLSSLVKRAGGVTDYAYTKGARLLRQLNDAELKRMKDALEAKMRTDKINTDSLNLDSLLIREQYVGIDLEKALKKPGGDDDIVLREGDVLTIPEYNNTVRISGGVLYPNTVTYAKRMTMDSYIRQAGGYSRLAMKSKPFVIYMNGKVASGRWAKIEPGCEIVVPEKPDREPISLQSIIGITTSLATLGLIITNLAK
ncbi:MAG: SLBB domain-containing protein [Bacteroidia bacterium]|nr:SLBB domain-containing protein [Bacteroidia bacterium]